MNDLNKKNENNALNSIIICLFAIIIGSVFLQFIPVNDSNWFTLGMGKVVAFGSLLGILYTIKKNYFGAFFICIFCFFFTVHEIIVYYDNYAILLGKECGDDGVFRSVIELFRNALTVKCGCFWSFNCSTLNFLLVSFAWMNKIVADNKRLAELNSNEDVNDLNIKVVY